MATLLLIGVLWQPGTAAATETTSWAWSSLDSNGDLAFRLTIDFGESNPCLFEVLTARGLANGTIAHFYGRDDESLGFFVGAYEGEGWSTFHNLGGDADSEGWNAGSQGFLRTAHDLTTTGVQSWIFAGYETLKVDPAEFPAWAQPPPQTFSLSISCSSPIAVESVERASFLPTFGPTDACELTHDLPVQLCGMAAAVDQQGSFELRGSRNVLRYHQNAWNPAVGYIRLDGPDLMTEQTYASVVLETGAPGIRLEGPVGTYGYELWHASIAPYVARGFAFAFDEIEPSRSESLVEQVVQPDPS